LEDSTDRRAKLLFLTPEGQLLVDRIQETVFFLENELFRSLSDSEISQVADFIMRLESAMNNGWLLGKQ
jgi:MarR family transcriptional regulator for hemolysin